MTQVIAIPVELNQDQKTAYDRMVDFVEGRFEPGTMFLLEDDIDMNHKIVERNRIKYTASTRPTDKLYIVKR